MEKKVIKLWTEYYILDSLRCSTKISDYPISDSTIVFDNIEKLKSLGYLDKNYHLTEKGVRLRNKLYKQLKLNRFNQHIYPKIDVFFPNNDKM